MKTVVGITILLSIALASQWVPIPKGSSYGLSIGDPTASKLHIEAFYDLLCPDSAASNNVFRDVWKSVIPSKQGIKFTYVFYPLPYHFYAFKVHQGYNYIKSLNETNAIKYIDWIFDTQSGFDEFNWRNKTIRDFISGLAQNVSVKLGVSATDFTNALSQGTKSDLQTRFEWKYGGTEHDISGTPIFYANGVRIDGAEDWKYQDWINFLSNYTSLSSAIHINEHNNLRKNGY